jgi:hypothetical protein
MTFEQFKKLNFEFAGCIGIKVKAPDGKEICFFRRGQRGIEEMVSQKHFMWNDEILPIIEHHMKAGELVFFVCCCRKCHKESNLAANRFYAATGERVSHGILKEHYEEEVEFMKQEMERR